MISVMGRAINLLGNISSLYANNGDIVQYRQSCPNIIMASLEFHVI